MADSTSDAVSVDMEPALLAGKEHIVKTSYGSLSVAVFGDCDKPALITYPDLALNYASCFQGLFCCPEAFSLLLQSFCIYHISPPGHEVGAAVARKDEPSLSVDDLANQIAEILDYFRVDKVMCLGVTAGAYILTLFAIQYPKRVTGLILVSPLCKAPSWAEWLSNKEALLMRYFSKEIRISADVVESGIIRSCRRFLGERHSSNVHRFLQAINRRPDISQRLRKLQCRTLIFVGEKSPFHHEALHMLSKLDRRLSALVEVQACGSVVTEEQPEAMLIPLEYFLLGYGFCRPSQFSLSPRSPLCPTSISSELFSPESMGLKLKPIKTKIQTKEV